MRKGTMRANRIIVLSAVTAFAITLTTGGILAFAQHSAQDEILAQSQQELEDDLEGQIVWTAPGRDSLYKDSEFVDADILQQVCEQYGLNYDTVTLREVSREAFDYEYALNAKSTEGEKTMQELAADIGDIYAFEAESAQAVIDEVCEAGDLDAASAQVKDLSVEQLMEIQERAYETSDHPK
ncbi:hypothetical protein [Ruminococcus gauvreauii]|uniref:DUF4825 domain-containing protein n=1 Tax=Ruminococcus gauvreauii TaxID=438033 RepID=A0ABY5VK82_9FIRM|nr:hypothetical protein [Ruminococcus gauvreauii]UWP60604.1 hypothetical protein NQ502_06125 [Ruminococcus gauvreauii]